MKTFALVLLLAAGSVICNESSTCNANEGGCGHALLNSAIDLISKAKCDMNSCSDSQLKKPVDCADVFHMGHRISDVYEIWPMNRMFDGKSINVYCDMQTDGGGWTVIQTRGDFGNPKDYFYRDWQNYKEGFGNIEEDFWLGNDKIYALTNQKLYSVRFHLEDVEDEKRYAVYDKFWIDDEERKYTLHISLYAGNAGDSMAYHNNKRFSTFDEGNVNNCARADKGGWWYDRCHTANLNGLYHKGKFSGGNLDGVSWQSFKGDRESLEWTEIKIRPNNFRASSS